MKAFNTLTVGTLCLFLSMCSSILFAQSERSVLAVSRDGISHNAPTQLKVAIVPCLNPLKFKVSLENSSEDYVKLVIKDTEGHIIHRNFLFKEKKAVMNFDMSKLEEGSYRIEVRSKTESYSYRIEVGSKVVRSIGIKLDAVAALPE
jgi:hypothetical protein